ncbi:MAG: hypothetical protein LBJ64_08100 [Deltaproteobacteria bacterium]|jgi:hypothetical protein|nr:hypothetical protein [Deltaproteobacteria bacterium]
MKPWKKDEATRDWYRAAASEVRRQALANLDISIPVDPDVAEYMGAHDTGPIPDDVEHPDEATLAFLEEYFEQEAERLFQEDAEKDRLNEG